MATLWTKDSDLTSQNGQKHAIAQYACQYLLQHAKHSVIGMGTGSTINYLIDALAPYKQFFTCIASSQATEQRLASHGIAIANTDMLSIDLYIDGADEIDPKGYMIKGGGGALTREKIIANMAKEFICLADASKMVQTLGAFAIPIEVLPMAVPLVINYLQKHYAQAKPILRKQQGKVFITDNHSYIVDVGGLSLTTEQAMGFEEEMQALVGVITAGIFAKNKAQQLFTCSINEDAASKAHNPLTMQIYSFTD